MPTLQSFAPIREVGLIAEVLQGLGGCADEVAETLQANKIHGVLNTVRILNPVARYVLGAVGPSVRSAHLFKPGVLTLYNADGTIEETPLTRAVANFQLAFDLGRYPELIEP